MQINLKVDQLDESCETWISITYGKGGEKYTEYGKNEERLRGLVTSGEGTAF